MANRSEQALRSDVAAHGVTIAGKFDRAELADIVDVLGRWKRWVGPLDKFGLVIENASFNPKIKCGPGATYHDAGPLCGYRYTGYVDPQDPKMVRIAPKRVVDAYARWMLVTGRMPKGEEKRPAGFRWSLSHELAHSIAYQIGLGYELQALFGIRRPREPSKAFSDWMKISDRVDDECPTLPQASDGGWANVRPMGYATQGSYFAENETYADAAAYLVMDATYASGDQCIAWRFAYLRNLFRQIKEGRRKLVDRDKYIRRHLLGQ